MKNPEDTRDVVPRFGSPPWIYLTTVSFAGAAVLGVAVAFRPSLGDLQAFAKTPMFWVVAAMILIAEIWPLTTPGRTGSDSPAISRTVTLAALLYWGFAIAVLLRAASIVLVGLARHSPHRVAFNAAQVSLSMGAAELVLLAHGVHATWSPQQYPNGMLPINNGTLPILLLAGLAYFVVNFVLVMGAIALLTRTPLITVVRAKLPFQAAVHLVLFTTALLVVLAMHTKSPYIVALLAFPLAAVYLSAAKSVQRDHQANHDELTGLLNRKLLTKRGGEALTTAESTGAKAGFLLIDLDRSTGLKQVNDTLGHAVGDRLLQIVAHRLEHSVRPGDVVARLGGDEFAVLLPSVKEAGAAREVASRLRAALAEPVRLEAMTFQVEASVGIAIYPDDASSFEQLMQRADVAMYMAKERHNGIERYTPDADRNSAERLALASDLRTAVMRGEIELHYQPKVRLSDRKTIGMEALARWQHPSKGMLAAAEFVDLAEQSHLISDMTEQILDMALHQTALWWAEEMPVQVCVNLPARDLHSIHLTEMISQALQRHDLPPDALRLDINEQVLAGKPAQAAAAISELAALGVGVSLDDFGTGYSSLAQLTRLGISEVRLDPGLVAGLPNCTERTMTVKSLVRLAQSLGIRSIGEGVETSSTAATLRVIGCDGAQGWYFARPMEASIATAWLFEQQVTEAAAMSSAGGPPQDGAEQVDETGPARKARQPIEQAGQVAHQPGQVAAEAYKGSGQSVSPAAARLAQVLPST
ncbi:MAG: putative bifunctional diguanylate cyclase/phosphodiesterase [Streptosporangiaceae bacterium]